MKQFSARLILLNKPEIMEVNTFTRFFVQFEFIRIPVALSPSHGMVEQ